MKRIRILTTALLSLSLAGVIPAYAQEQHEQEEQKEKPAEQKEKKSEPDKAARPEERGAPKENNARPEANRARQQDEKPKPEERNAQQRPAAQPHGGRIPADRYRANFGREHTFRVSQGDYGNRRFQYGGYWFGFAGAWPSNWLYTQDVFVVEIDGVYYLCNPNYPGVNVMLNVTM